PQAGPGTKKPVVLELVVPVREDPNLRNLPYIPPRGESEEEGPRTRYPHPNTGAPPPESPSSPWMQRLLKGLFRPTGTLPPPIITFDGITLTQSGCGCQPPDSQGDVGPNHYVNAVNQSIKIFDKSGNPLNGVNGTTFDSFFAAAGANPCGQGANFGDPFIFYDHQADRWVISDFAFPSFPGTSFWQCVGVSASPDPVAGPWNLYAIQIDPANPNQLGDYPKMALWNDGGTQNAYFLTVNLFTPNFVGVRVFALDRASMLTGGPANAIAFTITPAGLGDSYSLVPAGFRTGDPPPTGRDEMLLAVDSPSTENVTLTQVKAWLFHVDFVTPTNSTLGIGTDHSPNALITVTP